MSTITVDKAPVTQVVSHERAQRRAISPATNLEAWSTPLVSDEQRKAINEELQELGAAELRSTHATESVARKAIRVALREAGFPAPVARSLAVELVRECR